MNLGMCKSFTIILFLPLRREDNLEVESLGWKF